MGVECATECGSCYRGKYPAGGKTYILKMKGEYQRTLKEIIDKGELGERSFS